MLWYLIPLVILIDVVALIVSPPQNTGDRKMRITAAARPPYMLHTAPRVVNPRQKSE